MSKLLVRVKSRMFIRANRRVLSLLDGQYVSLSRGRSMDFDDLRAYVAGDEVKDIDWKATARYGAPLVRNYSANRQHELVVVIDTGRGMAALAESAEPKRDIAVLVMGVLGYLSLRHGDRVSLAYGNAEGFHRARAASTEGQLEGLLRRVDSATTVAGPSSDLPGLLRYAMRAIRKRSLVLVVSDDFVQREEVDETTRLLQARHEVLWVSIADADLVRGVGAERVMVDVDDAWAVPEFLRGNSALAAEFDAAGAARAAAAHEQLGDLGISHLRVGSSPEVVTGLLALLRRRANARR